MIWNNSILFKHLFRTLKPNPLFSTVEWSKSFPEPSTILLPSNSQEHDTRGGGAAEAASSPTIPHMLPSPVLCLLGASKALAHLDQKMVPTLCCTVLTILMSHLMRSCASFLLIHIMALILLTQRKLLNVCIFLVSFFRFPTDST